MYWPPLLIAYADNVDAGDRKPWSTYALLLACLLVFAAMRWVEMQGLTISSFDQLLWLSSQDNKDWLYRTFAFIPQAASIDAPGQALSRLFNSLFMHDSWRHLLLNMSALLLFGRSVERRLGSRLFVSFYLGAGLFASGVQWWDDPNSAFAQVGASGATWAITAAYLIWFPRAKVRGLALVPLVNLPVPLPPINVWLFLSGAAATGLVWSTILRAVEQSADAAHVLGASPPSAVSSFAHLGGALFGLAIASMSTLWTKYGRGKWYQNWYRPQPVFGFNKAVMLYCLAILSCGWALSVQARMVAVEVLNLQPTAATTAKEADGGLDGDISKGLGDALAKNFDAQKLRSDFAKANRVLPAFIEHLETHAELMQPFEDACKSFADLAGRFKQAADDQARHQVAQAYFATAGDALAKFNALLSSDFGPQLRDYIQLEQALANYFSLEFSTPLLPPSQEEASAKQLLLHAFEHITALRDAIQEQARLQALSSRQSRPGLSPDAAALAARLTELGDQPVCQQAHH